MPHNTASNKIVDLIERRVRLNQKRGNSNPVTLTATIDELKALMSLDRLKTITRNRLISKLESHGYEVTFTGGELVITVDPAERDCLFTSIEELEDSLEDAE